MRQNNGNYRWRIVALLFFATTINYIDRQVIGILKPVIAEDLGWTEADYGYIVSAFQVAYAIGMVATGWFLDKVGTKVGYIIAIVVWSIAGIGHAFARSVFSFGLARFVLGIGESANFPACIKAVSEWFPKKDRALATGWFNSGASIGAIVGPMAVAGIATLLSWRWAFIITGALGFVWLVLWWMQYEAPQRHKKLLAEELRYIMSDNGSDETCSNEMRWGSLFRFKQTYAIIGARLVTDWVWWFFLFWTPDYLHKMFNLNLSESIIPLIIIYTVSSVGGIGGGLMASKFIAMGKSIGFARKKTILICALMVLPLSLISRVDSIWIAVMIIAFAAAAHQGWAANMYTTISDIYPKNAVGSMVGLSGVLGSVMSAFAAALVGWILQLTHSYEFIFMVASCTYMVAWLIFEIFLKKIEPLHQPLQS